MSSELKDKLFFDCMAQQVIKTYSLKELSKPDKIFNFIIDKLNGALVNIDSTDLTSLDISFFKKLISDKQFVAQNDNILGKISHRNTIQYIFISDNITQINSTFKDIDYDLIDFTGDISKVEYCNLAKYECLLMVVASIYKTISINNNSSPKRTIILCKFPKNSFKRSLCLQIFKRILPKYNK